MMNIQKAKCYQCGTPLGLSERIDTPERECWLCPLCRTINYVTDGTKCDCPTPGFGKGCHCRVDRNPKLVKFTSDDWCNCRCHVERPAASVPAPAQAAPP